MPTPPEITAALAALPGAGSARLGRLLATDAATAWASVREGTVGVDVAPATTRTEWKQWALAADLAIFRAQLDAQDVTVTNWHDPAHPPQFRADIDPAPIAFRRGSLPDPDAAHVAIVGTRRASSIGREIAREVGYELASAGVVVVSGLALGIDGAAHAGAVAARGERPVAVVGSGLDVIYPRSHEELWAQVARDGALLSEAPLGAQPEPWRFPARNRLIVAMADVVVVVESRATGGSLLTVDEAVRRGVDVLAVPGSLRNGAAVGTNQLLADGCAPVRDVDDVMVALGLDVTGAAERRAGERRGPESLSASATRLLSAIDDGPTSVDDLIRRLGVDAGFVFAALAELELADLVIPDGARVRRR